MWFLPFASWRQSDWLLPLVRKLLDNDAHLSRLLAHNPFLVAAGGAAQRPRWVRAVLWEYEFAEPGGASGDYWRRTFVREWMPPQCRERLGSGRPGF